MRKEMIQKEIRKLMVMLKHREEKGIDINDVNLILDEAKEHLKDSKDVASLEKFRIAIEQLQLCIEKLAKARGIFLGVIDRKKGKEEIVHLTPKIYEKMLQEKEFLSFFIVFQEINPIAKRINPIKELNQFFNELRSKSKRMLVIEKMARMSKEETNFVLDLTEKITEGISKESDKTLEELFNKFSSPNKEYFKSCINRKKWRKYKSYQFKRIYPYLCIDMKLFILILLTFAHYNCSRYNKTAFEEPIEYNKELGIVYNINRIIALTESCINDMEEEIRVYSSNEVSQNNSQASF